MPLVSQQNTLVNSVARLTKSQKEIDEEINAALIAKLIAEDDDENIAT